MDRDRHSFPQPRAAHVVLRTVGHNALLKVGLKFGAGCQRGEVTPAQAE